MSVKPKSVCRECGPIDDPSSCRSRGHVVNPKKKYATNNGIGKRCRCSRRSWDDCPHVWRFAFMWKGARYRGSLHVTKREPARAEFARITAQIMAGTYEKKIAPTASRPVAIERPTFAVVAAQYADRHVKSRLASSAIKLHDGRITFLAGVTVAPGVSFTEKPFALITIDDIEVALTAKRTPIIQTYRKGEKTWERIVGGDIAANRLRDHLCGLWNWALSKGYTDSTPFNRGGRVPDELKKTREHHRTRRLAMGEERRLLDAAEPHLKDCIVCLLETGMRKGELLSLRWRHVRWLQNELSLEWTNTKTKTSRKIPLSTTMRDLLLRRQRDSLATLPKPFNPGVSDADRLSNLYVFGNAIGERIGDIKTAWSKTCERAKIHDLHVHDLRREAGSRKLEGSGEYEPWPLNAVSKWLGHANITMTAAYLNADDDFLQKLNERRRPMLVKQ